MSRSSPVTLVRQNAFVRARLAETLLSIDIDPGSPVSLRRQLYVELRTIFLRVHLPPGTRLPSSRKLARTLNVSRTTVVEAFDRLTSEGILTGRRGSGTFVASRARHERTTTIAPAAPRLSLRGNRIMAASEGMTNTVDRPRGAFRNGLPALDTIGNAAWARHLSRVARTLRLETLDYGDPAGYLPLRACIAERLAVTRGIACSAENVVVVAGTQQALDYIAQLLIDPGDAVCVEDPGYVPARCAFAATGARLVPGPVDDEGLDVAAARAREPHPRLIVVTPSHQFPLAVTLSARRREALVDWAQSAQSWIVEDDYESEFRYDGKPLHALQTLDESGRVIYVGTFSKTLFPSLRVGYIVAPPALRNAFRRLARVGVLSPKVIEQAALASFLDSGDFAQHVQRARRLCALRQRTLVEQVEARGEAPLTLRTAASGLHLFGRLSPEIADTAVAAHAATCNVYVAPASALTLEARCNGLVLGYAVTTPNEIRRAVGILYECIERVRDNHLSPR